MLTKPRDQTLLLNSSALYQLSEINEPDYQPTLLIAHSYGKKTLPSFVSFDNATRMFFFTPELSEHLGLHKIVLELTDFLCEPQIYEFKIMVINFTRKEFNFTQKIPPNITRPEKPIIEE